MIHRVVTLDVTVPETTSSVVVAILCHDAVGIDNDVRIVKSKLVEEDD
jgi:hypothetical protein